MIIFGSLSNFRNQSNIPYRYVLTTCIRVACSEINASALYNASRPDAGGEKKREKKTPHANLGEILETDMQFSSNPNARDFAASIARNTCRRLDSPWDPAYLARRDTHPDVFENLPRTTRQEKARDFGERRASRANQPMVSDAHVLLGERDFRRASRGSMVHNHRGEHAYVTRNVERARGTGISDRRDRAPTGGFRERSVSPGRPGRWISRAHQVRANDPRLFRLPHTHTHIHAHAHTHTARRRDETQREDKRKARRRRKSMASASGRRGEAARRRRDTTRRRRLVQPGRKPVDEALARISGTRFPDFRAPASTTTWLATCNAVMGSARADAITGGGETTASRRPRPFGRVRKRRARRSFRSLTDDHLLLDSLRLFRLFFRVSHRGV